MVGLRGIPATYGGVERAVEELSATLVGRGHHMTVFAREAYSDTSVIEHRGVEIVHLAQIDTKHLEALSHTAWAVLVVLAQRRFDVIHFHAPALPSSRSYRASSGCRASRPSRASTGGARSGDGSQRRRSAWRRGPRPSCRLRRSWSTRARPALPVHLRHAPGLHSERRRGGRRRHPDGGPMLSRGRWATWWPTDSSCSSAGSSRRSTSTRSSSRTGTWSPRFPSSSPGRPRILRNTWRSSLQLAEGDPAFASSGRNTVVRSAG